MAFSVNYNVGGKVDEVDVVNEVKNLKGGKLDQVVYIDEIGKIHIPGFPTLGVPFTKGLKINIPATMTTHTIEYVPTVDMELSGVIIACSGYADDDYWELIINGVTYYETIYTKELPEMSPQSGVIPVAANTAIAISFHNDSGTSKTVWFNLKFFK